MNRLKALAVDTGGAGITYGMFSHLRKSPGLWRAFLDLADETAAEGGRMLIQAHSRWMSTVGNFLSRPRCRSTGYRSGATSASFRWRNRKRRCAIPRFAAS